MTRPDSFCAGWLVLALATTAQAALPDFSALHDSPRHKAPDAMTPWNGARQLSDEERQWQKNWQLGDRKSTPEIVREPTHPLPRCIAEQDMTTFCRHIRWIYRHTPAEMNLIYRQQNPMHHFKKADQPRFKFFH